jgi:hypothetical protein
MLVVDVVFGFESIPQMTALPDPVQLLSWQTSNPLNQCKRDISMKILIEGPDAVSTLSPATAGPGGSPEKWL